MSRVKVFAFPYAIGNANAFNDYKEFVRNDFEVIAHEYPGHGSRFLEPCLKTIEDMAMDAYENIKDKIDGAYIILGYSMGSLVCYELLRIIEKEHKRMPIAAFFMASESPGTEPVFRDCDNMNLEQVRELLVSMEGTPKEVIESDEMISLLSNIVKSDYGAIERYEPELTMLPKASSYYVIRGDREEYPSEEMMGWGIVCGENCKFIEFSGSHFFLFDDEKNMIKLYELMKKTSGII